MGFLMDLFSRIKAFWNTRGWKEFKEESTVIVSNDYFFLFPWIVQYDANRFFLQDQNKQLGGIFHCPLYCVTD